MALPSVPRELSAKEDSKVQCGTGRPGTAGGSRRYHGFCQRENFVIE